MHKLLCVGLGIGARAMGVMSSMSQSYSIEAVEYAEVPKVLEQLGSGELEVGGVVINLSTTGHGPITPALDFYQQVLKIQPPLPIAIVSEWAITNDTQLEELQELMNVAPPRVLTPSWHFGVFWPHIWSHLNNHPVRKV